MPQAVEQEEMGGKSARAPNRGHGVHLFDVSGIRITVDYSWLIIFALVLGSLSAGYFPHYFPSYDARSYWLAGFIATMLFFASILLHELSHSLTAVRLGLRIPEITLFIFGGVARLSDEPSNPKTELKIAIAGPAASLLLALLFWMVRNAMSGYASDLVVAVFDYLAWINVALAVFNLVPGYPLDGGRILRALVWWRTGSVAVATKLASDIGKGFAWALIILGGIQIFSGALIGGLWLLFIGMFLRGIAIGGYQEVMMKQALGGVHVSEVMIHNVVGVPSETPLDRLAEAYFLRYGFGGFPVVDGERPVGLIALGKIADVPPGEMKTTTVAKVMTPLSEEIQIQADATLVDALKKMTQSGNGRLLVIQDGTMLGMITKTGLLRFLEIKKVLKK